MDDIISGSPLCPRVMDVAPTDDYKLLLTFTSGERRMFDFTPLLEMPVFEPLTNKSFFRSVKVAYGSVFWPRDIDYCPDTLYMESTPITDGLPEMDIRIKELQY